MATGTGMAGDDSTIPALIPPIPIPMSPVKLSGDKTPHIPVNIGYPVLVGYPWGYQKLTRTCEIGEGMVVREVEKNNFVKYLV